MVGTNAESIVEEVGLLLSDDAAYKTMSAAHNPYGDEKASKKIIEYLKSIYKT